MDHHVGGSGLWILIEGEKTLKDDGRLLVVGEGHEALLGIFIVGEEASLLELHDESVEDGVTETGERRFISRRVAHVE
jgi:hypothetical protein